jgi:ABC-2 type transport system ATP-binding protein
MTPIAVLAEHLTRNYGTFRALDDLSLAIEKGTIVGLLGPNGAGKTTFLKLLLGLLAPTAGGSWVLGSPSRALPAEVSGRIAALIEGRKPPEWAVMRNVMKLQKGASPKFDWEFCKQHCLSRAVCPKTRYGTLSKGQKRWFLSGLTLAMGAEILLMDEPADGLDPSARRELYEKLRAYANEHEATIIVASHILSDIERVADDVAIIDHGRLMLYDSLENLRDQVREVELPSAEAIPDFGPDVTVLSSRRAGEALLVCVQCRNAGDAELRGRVDARAVIRTVGLEALYLAVAEHRGTNGSMRREEVA